MMMLIWKYVDVDYGNGDDDHDDGDHGDDDDGDDVIDDKLFVEILKKNPRNPCNE